jgi:prolyl-tRNA editing enzyme YbaK/EbsC (Cys-tRNA(Pro) deacylase)
MLSVMRGTGMEILGEMHVRQFFSSLGLEKRIESFAESTENSFLAAQALGVEQGQIVKSVLFLADEQPVLVLMSGDMNVHNKKLKSLLRVRKVKIADPDTVVAVTGFAVGGVPPVAHLQPVPTFIDGSLSRFAEIYPAAGTANNMFRTTFEELAQLTKARMVDVAMPKKRP